MVRSGFTCKFRSIFGNAVLGTARMTERATLAGLSLFSGGPESLLRLVLDKAQSGDALCVHFISANSVWQAEKDPEFRELLSSGGLLAPDSRWVEWCSRLTGPKAVQTRGPRIFEEALTLTQGFQLKHFFVGPNKEVNFALARALEDRFPVLSIGDFLEAPFSPFDAVDMDALVEAIECEEPSIVWLGIGTPAQDILAVELTRRTNCVVLAVGAAFEFLAGLKPEAPATVSRLGFEWLYRLLAEPGRLWRRYLIGNVVFLRAVTKHWVVAKKATRRN